MVVHRNTSLPECGPTEYSASEPCLIIPLLSIYLFDGIFFYFFKKEIIYQLFIYLLELFTSAGHENSEYVLGFEIGQQEGGFYSRRTDG